MTTLAEINAALTSLKIRMIAAGMTREWRGTAYEPSASLETSSSRELLRLALHADQFEQGCMLFYSTDLPGLIAQAEEAIARAAEGIAHA